MIIINKKKFLTELNKLLIFMYEEDRLEAISLYEQMFEDAVDETELLQFLSSPTRQAVIVARAYKAKERKLGITSQSGDEAADIAGNSTPLFVNAINDLYSEALERGIVTSQFTEIFSEDEEVPVPDEVPGEKGSDVPGTSGDETAGDVLSDTQGNSSPVEVDFPDISLEMPDEVTQFLSETSSSGTVESDNSSSSTESIASPPAEEILIEETEPKEEPEFPLDDEDNYHFNLGPAPAPVRSDPDAIDAAMATFKPSDVPDQKSTVPEEDQLEVPGFHKDLPENPHPWKKEAPEPESSSGKLFAPMVVLYLIAAVPITALCIAVLLIPTLLFCGLSIAAGVYSFRLITLAFGNFAVFADIMAVLGGGLILLALALLFFWIFLWFIGAVIAGLINFVIRLGGKICYKDGKNHE